MPETITGTIDGRRLKVERGTTALEAARSLGLEIPTLCLHEGLPPDGNCRLCLVEISGGLAASCLYPLRSEGFEILTASPAVLASRSFVLSLLLNRAPKDPVLLRLAGEFGASPNPRFQDDPDGCLRCGRCVRACRSLGTEALCLVGRGRDRRVSGPFFEPPSDCVGCLACARVCPTGHVKFEEEGDRRRVWGREFQLSSCPSCGRPWATAEQLARDRAPDAICPDCRRRLMARALSAAPRPSPSTSTR
jgi:NADH dehydrogenase/NADH:ubiquinone oxidoreductase subunit G